MRRLLYKLRRSLRVRSVIESAISRSHPGLIRDLLAQYPDADELIAKKATALFRADAPWSSLVLCLGLVESRSARGLEVLRCLLSRAGQQCDILRYQVPWSRLSAEQAGSLVCFLQQQGWWRDFDSLYDELTDEQLLWVRPATGGLSLSIWTLTALLRGCVPIVQADAVLDFGALGALRLVGTGQDWPEILEHYFGKACENLDRARSDAALGTAVCAMAFLSGLRAEPVAEDNLALVAAALPQLDDERLTCAAKLLARHPSMRWIEALRGEWLSLEDHLRRDLQEIGRESLDGREAAAAHAVARALAACAACDPGYRNFDGDTETSPALPELIEREQRLASEHDRLVRHFKHEQLQGQPSAHRNRVERISELQRELAEIEPAISEERQRHRGRLSAGFLLWCVLQDSQSYPIFMRQAAAWGLHLLRQQGHLDPATRDVIADAIRAAVQSEHDHGFCERLVHVLPDQGVLELLQSLRDGLQWMVFIAEGVYARNCAGSDGGQAEGGDGYDDAKSASRMAPYDGLEETVRLMCRKLPGVLDFLKQYPLRLMRLDHHREVLGQYTVSGCELQLWTRYEPPPYAGPVERRYLQVCDRSRPNAMGIYYRLFCSPLLVLPVIYHETLHYGGKSGDPDRGLANESEVLLREIVFARKLIAELAEHVADDALPDFERSIVRMIEFAGVPSLLHQWLCDLTDDSIWSEINREVVATYGDPLDDETLERAVELYLVMQNMDVDLANLVVEHQGWYPEIRWPSLVDPAAREERLVLDRTIRDRWKRWHRVSADRRDEILDELEHRESVRCWESYCRRLGALERLEAVRRQTGIAGQDERELIVRRFPFQPQAPQAPHLENVRGECETWQAALESFEEQLVSALASQQYSVLLEIHLLVQQLGSEIDNCRPRFETVVAAARQFDDGEWAGSLCEMWQQLTQTLDRVRGQLPEYMSRLPSSQAPAGDARELGDAPNGSSDEVAVDEP